MKFLKSALAALVLMAPLAGAPAAHAADWNIDQSHSTITWTVDHMVISEVSGTFNAFSGKMTNFDGKDPTKATVEVKVEAKSIDSNNEKRDKHLRDGDFLDVAKYPHATFTSKSFKKTSDKKYDVTGDFTLHGVTKTVTIPMTFKGTVTDPWGNTRAGFVGKTTIDRQDYGVSYSSTLEAGGLTVGNDVTLELRVELVKGK